ncbi:MAG: Asp-tRNA(Asn)/Glu-tRNA(Gln) amidotransferase subunit GatC [Atopobiaceae bacterium]
MALTEQDVADIAEYARIALTPEELSEMCQYMNETIEILQPIREYDLEGVTPTFHPIGDLSNVMGEDIVDDSCRALSIEDALKNAGSTEGRSFRVPSILGDEGGDLS